MSQWYYARQGRTFGPFTTRELSDLARAGKLLPGDLVSQPGATSWQPANTVPGVFDGSVTRSAAVPPPPPVVKPVVHPAPASVLTPITSPAPEVDFGPPVRGKGLAGILLGLPKPVLFGLFGAIGGLLGAVLLAEGVWWLLQPPDVSAQLPRVQIAVPETVRTYVGGKNRFVVKIARGKRFDGPVVVETSNASNKITAASVRIPQGSDQADVEVQTLDKTPPGTYPLQVRVSSPEEKRFEPVTTSLNLSVEAIPPGLSVAASREVTVEQGGRGRFTVRIARARFDQDVTLRFDGTPDGVTLPANVVLREATTDATVDVNARADAPLANTPVTVHAFADVGGSEVSGDAKFNLIVKKRSPPTVDVLFVLDLTGSMQFAIDGIKRGIQSFVEQLEGKDIDIRIGLIGFRDIQEDNERPYELKFDGSTFTKDYKAFRDKVTLLKAGGGGDIPESSLQGLALAARQPFRGNASRVLILITDAIPKIHPDEMPSTIPQTIEELKKHEIDQLHLVVKQDDLNSHYKAFREDFKGSFFDINKATGGDAFADLLPALSRDISRISISSPPRTTSRGSEPPPLPEASTPSLPPAQEVPKMKAVQSDKEFAAKDLTRVLIAVMVWTGVVAGAISLLLLAGQQFHARQSWVGLSEGAWAVMGGVVAGLVGGGVGQIVFQSTSGAESWEWASRFIEPCIRILSWSLIGGLIGVLLAFFVPNLKWYRGGLGGLAGGFCGAVGYLLVAGLMSSLLGRWLGAAILGLCLGLMVALAELAFRRWWLEIAVSPREVRTMTLGSTAITLGSDERQSSFFVAGARPVALRYWVDNNEVYCEDAASGQTTLVQPGESRQVGKVAVTMRSVSASKQTGYVLELLGGRKLQLQDGMPLTAEDLPGLEPRGSDGMVALVSAQPNRPQEVMLRNRSKQSWTIRDARGNPRTIDPGRGIELGKGIEVNFGQVQGTIQAAELS